LENAYQVCLCHELTLRKIPFRSQLDLPLHYKDIALDCAYRMDIVGDDLLLLELKAVERMDAVF